MVVAFVLSTGAGVAHATTWSVDNPTVTQSGAATQVTFTLTASGLTPVLGSASVGYATADGSAKAPGDYTAAQGTASVSNLLGSTASTTVTVNVNGNASPQFDKTFSLVLNDGSNTTGVATIVNGVPPHLTVTDPTVHERDGTAVFTVALDGAADVTVDYATADGSAVAGRNYQAMSGTLHFARGEGTKQVSVPIIDDKVHEDTQTFSLNLSNATNIAAGGNKLAGTGTILDDDPLPPPAPASTSTSAGATPGLSGASLGDFTNPQPRLTRPRDSRGTILIAITCPATELLCRGTLTTFAEPDRRARDRWLHSEHWLGSATFVIAGGKRALITTRIAHSALARLRRAGRVTIRSYAVVRDAAGNIGTASVGARLARVR